MIRFQTLIFTSYKKASFKPTKSSESSLLFAVAVDQLVSNSEMESWMDSYWSRLIWKWCKEVLNMCQSTRTCDVLHKVISTYQCLELWRWAPSVAAPETELLLWPTHASSVLQYETHLRISCAPEEGTEFSLSSRQRKGLQIYLTTELNGPTECKTNPGVETKSQQRWDCFVATATAFKAKGCVFVLSLRKWHSDGTFF